MNYKIGKVSDFMTSPCKSVEINGKSIAIYYTAGEFFAVSNVCPHKGAELCKGSLRGTMLPSEPSQLHYGMEEQVIACPWHGWEFDVKNGKALFGTTKSKLKTYSIYQDNGELYISMESRKEETAVE